MYHPQKCCPIWHNRSLIFISSLCFISIPCLAGGVPTLAPIEVIGSTTNRFNLTGMAYSGKWNSTDQIPQRAVSNGLINRFDAIDPPMVVTLFLNDPVNGDMHKKDNNA